MKQAYPTERHLRLHRRCKCDQSEESRRGLGHLSPAHENRGSFQGPEKSAQLPQTHEQAPYLDGENGGSDFDSSWVRRCALLCSRRAAPRTRSIQDSSSSSSSILISHHPCFPRPGPHSHYSSVLSELMSEHQATLLHGGGFSCMLVIKYPCR